MTEFPAFSLIITCLVL